MQLNSRIYPALTKTKLLGICDIKVIKQLFFHIQIFEQSLQFSRYIFITAFGVDETFIIRYDMDGSNAKYIITRELILPTGLTVGMVNLYFK